MWGWVDRLGAPLFDTSLAALLLWAGVALAMLGCRQPARRLRLARAAVVASLALWPLVGLGLVPRLDVSAALHGVGVLPHPIAAPGGSAEAGLAAVGALPDWVGRGLTLLYI